MMKLTSSAVGAGVMVMLDSESVVPPSVHPSHGRKNSTLHTQRKRDKEVISVVRTGQKSFGGKSHVSDDLTSTPELETGP
jgi:hypothetical protein